MRQTMPMASDEILNALGTVGGTSAQVIRHGHWHDQSILSDHDRAGNANLLAEVSEALVFGRSNGYAIPALVAHRFLQRRVSTLVL